MNNEKYLNYYVEVLTSTMTDCVIRNVSMQANAKVTDEVIKDQEQKIIEYARKLADLQVELTQLTNNKSASDNSKISELEKVNKELKDELATLNNKFRDYDSIKNQATHTDTFRNELLKAREDAKRIQTESNTRIEGLTKEYENKVESLKQNYESTISELNKKIDYLQLTPAQRRKLDALNKKEEPAQSVLLQASVDSDESIKDGGTF